MAKAKKKISDQSRRRAKATPQRKAPRRLSGKLLPAQQGRKPKPAAVRPKRTDVGPGRPPVEHQFQPGQSGNPDGAPAARSNLWRHFCRFLELTPAELTKLGKDARLSMSQRAALKQVQQLAKKGLAGTAWLATREAWNRDEGKPTEHVRYEREEALTEEECEEIRRAMGGQV